jgi:tRNA pseudouridine55 synthase
VVCSKGTYIRALARDIGAALGSGGHLTALRRTRVGNVTLDDCLTVEQAAELIHTVDIEMPEDSAN